MDSKLANPGPLGLAAFGMTTILLNLHNAGFYPLTSMVMAMGIFFGGIAQVIAGKFDFSKGNTFGMVAFTSYGMFWISLVAIWVLPLLGIAKPGAAEMGWFLSVWGVFSVFMTIGTLKGSKVLTFVFVTLDILFALLAIRDFTGSAVIGTIAGIEGIVCGTAALYLAMAEVLYAQFDKKILPF